MPNHTSILFGLDGVAVTSVRLDEELRWRCQNPDCPRATFTEALPQIPSRARLSGRLRESAGAAVADRGRTVIQSARDHEISWPIANQHGQPR